MTLTAELDMISYDIEQLWIEGMSPVKIAGEIDCHIDLVHAWIELNGLSAKETGDVYDPYATINS
jgi:hypothetical protein